jgi:CRISPR/Cas system-associated exonuclease Cas4 (RecB family)
MAEIKNLEKVIAQLRAKAAKSRQDAKASVSVGYTQSYSLVVHENLEAFHPVGKAKYLSDPARLNQARYAEIVEKAMRQGKTMSQSLLLAGLALQRDSQSEVPVDTGALRGSAFTRLDS